MLKKALTMLVFWCISIPCFAVNTMLILGDSLSASYGVSRENAWVSLLKQRVADQYPCYQVINASVSGDTTAEGKQRLPMLLKEYQPDVVLIELGGNDGLRGLSLGQIKNNLSSLAKIVKESDANTKVLLMEMKLPPNYGEAFNQQFTQLFHDVSSDNSVRLIPFFLNNVATNPDLMQNDRIHPNTIAQPLLLENIWPFIREELKSC